nr:nucleotidyltransferase family protein [Shewanella sairae]
MLEDDYRLQALLTAESLKLNDWMLAAGFVRNLVWDKLHCVQTRLNDIDLIYFDAKELSVEKDKSIEAELRRIAPMYPWSVKNQARMHLRNHHQAYTSCIDAMSYWPEKQTAVGVSCQPMAFSDSIQQISLRLHTPFNLTCLFDLSLQYNPKAPLEVFLHRVKNKRWLQSYPKLRDNILW